MKKFISVVVFIFILTLYFSGFVMGGIGLLSALFGEQYPKGIPWILFLILVTTASFMCVRKSDWNTHNYVSIWGMAFILFFIFMMGYTVSFDPEDLKGGGRFFGRALLFMHLCIGATGSFLMLLGSGLAWYRQSVIEGWEQSFNQSQFDNGQNT